MCAAGRNLRQMRDTDNLMRLCDLLELLSDDAGSDAADAVVDLIKNQRRYAVIGTDDVFERQHDTGHFTAGGDLCKRFERLTLVCGDQNFAAIRAVLTWRRQRLYRNGKLGICKVQTHELCLHFFGKRCGCLAAEVGQCTARCVQLLFCLQKFLLKFFLLFIKILNQMEF